MAYNLSHYTASSCSRESTHDACTDQSPQFLSSRPRCNSVRQVAHRVVLRVGSCCFGSTPRAPIPTICDDEQRPFERSGNEHNRYSVVMHHTQISTGAEGESDAWSNSCTCVSIQLATNQVEATPSCLSTASSSFTMLGGAGGATGVRCVTSSSHDAARMLYSIDRERRPIYVCLYMGRSSVVSVACIRRMYGPYPPQSFRQWDLFQHMTRTDSRQHPQRIIHTSAGQPQ